MFKKIFKNPQKQTKLASCPVIILATLLFTALHFVYPRGSFEIVICTVLCFSYRHIGILTLNFTHFLIFSYDTSLSP